MKKGNRKVFSELDGDGRMRHGRWPGWKEQKVGSSQDEKKKKACRVCPGTQKIDFFHVLSISIHVL